MLWVDKHDNELVVHIEEGDTYENLWAALVDVYNATDSLDLCNEGAPVNLGNMYAQYEFTAYVDGFVYTFPFGPDEFDELMAEREVTLYPLRDNYLPDMPEFIRPDWAA